MIPFKYGTQEQYEAQVKDNSALYFISDTKRVYRGEELIAGVETAFVYRLPSFEDAADGVIYILISGESAQAYIKSENGLIALSANLLDGSIDRIKLFDPDMILFADDDIDSAPDDSLVTTGAMKKAVNKATGSWEYLDGTEDQSKVYG